MDWNSDGFNDIVSGDRYGNFNLFLWQDMGLTAYYRARVLVNGDSVNVGTNSQPAVADWDRDGKKDLLLGCETGYIYLYLNQNTDALPLFQDYSYIQCNGAPIMLNRVNPYVFDLDQDGKRDLICGANDGYVHYFHNVGSDTNPTFLREETLKADNGMPIMPDSTPYGSRMGFGDWNNDGWPDFLISGYDGYVELWLGGPLTGVADKHATVLPTPPMLRVRPNPARGPVAFEYSLPRASDARLEVFDANGRRVANLFSGACEAGAHQLRWNASCPAGVYVARLTTPHRILTQQVTLLAK